MVNIITNKESTDDESNIDITDENVVAHVPRTKIQGNDIEKLMGSVMGAGNVVIADLGKVKSILIKLKKDSHRKLQIISDFDRTISAYIMPNGESSYSSYRAILSYKNEIYNMATKEAELRERYHPIETNKNLKNEEKIPHMIEWWNLSNEILLSAGISMNEIAEISKNCQIHLRDGFVDCLKKAQDLEVPIIVASAGIGDLVTSILHQERLNLKKIKITANFLEYNEKGIVTGFIQPLIHSYNKHLIADIAKSHFDEHADRKNIVVLGDTIGDVDVIKTFSGDHCTLKIGFLNFDVKNNLNHFQEVFDIVVIDPISAYPLNIILDYILDSK